MLAGDKSEEDHGQGAAHLCIAQLLDSQRLSCLMAPGPLQLTGSRVPPDGFGYECVGARLRLPGKSPMMTSDL